MHSTLLPPTLLAAVMVLPAALSSFPPADVPIVINDNREPAGVLRDGVLTLELEITEGDWHLLGDEQPAARIRAFAERGSAPSIPGPLIRVPVGTDLAVRLTNTLDSAVAIHGLGSRRDASPAPITVPARSTREVRFAADVAGTFYYWGAAPGVSMGQRIEASSQLTGALIIDDPTAAATDRVFVIGMWADGRRPDGQPDLDREFLTINGRPWPFNGNRKSMPASGPRPSNLESLNAVSGRGSRSGRGGLSGGMIGGNSGTRVK